MTPLPALAMEPGCHVPAMEATGCREHGQKGPERPRALTASGLPLTADTHMAVPESGTMRKYLGGGAVPIKVDLVGRRDLLRCHRLKP